MKDRYDFKAIEEKWQKIWEDTDVFHVTEDPDKEKYYAWHESKTKGSLSILRRILSLLRCLP